jgi:3-isopropylmalate/(R)-2-methylmalate dehydratase small subunit
MDSLRILTTGKGIPVPGNDIDTDRIIPARFMKGITFDGLGDYAFYDVRFRDDGTPKDHPFNDPRYTGAAILVAGKNFGCGSSREHAPQALMRWGIKAVIAESFAEIFRGNCTSLGIPAVTVPEADAANLMKAAESGISFTVDLDRRVVTCTSGGGELTVPCDIPDSARNSLVEGSWDTTAELLKNRDAILKKGGDLPYGPT